MAHLSIPVAATAYQSFSVQLDGSVYRMRIRYNSRSGVWTLDLFDSAEQALLCGLALRTGIDLLDQYVDDRLPPGRLFIVNFVSEHGEPGRDDLGTDAVLVYEEAA